MRLKLRSPGKSRVVGVLRSDHDRFRIMRRRMIGIDLIIDQEGLVHHLRLGENPRLESAEQSTAPTWWDQIGFHTGELTYGTIAQVKFREKFRDKIHEEDK